MGGGGFRGGVGLKVSLGKTDRAPVEVSPLGEKLSYDVIRVPLDSY